MGIYVRNSRHEYVPIGRVNVAAVVTIVEKTSPALVRLNRFAETILDLMLSGF